VGRGLTTPLDSQAYPSTPTGPSSAPEGYVTPATLTPDSSPPVSAEEIAAKRGNFIELILREVVRGLTGVFLPGAGPAFDQLIGWVQNILPDEIMAPILALVNILVDVLDLIPVIGAPAGDMLEYFASIFGLMRDNTDVAQQTGDNAQTSADHANVGVAQLEAKLSAGDVPSGELFSDTFNRTSTTSLGADYSQTSAGAAGGNLGTDGNNAVFAPTGAGAGDRYARVTATTLFTDYQGCQVVQDSAVPNILTPPQFGLILRANAAMTAYVIAFVGNNRREIGKVIGGSYTQLWIAAGDNATGDRWTFKAGTDVDSRELVLYRNSDLVHRITDTTSTHTIGASNRFGGFMVSSGLQFIPPFFTGQVNSTAIQSLDIYDRLAAA